MKLKNKVLLYLSCLFIFAVVLMAFKTWINYKSIIDFENKLVKNNIQNLVDTISLSHEKLMKTIEIYSSDLVNLEEMIKKDVHQLSDSFIRDDFTHLFLLDENKSIIKSIVYFEEIYIYDENEIFLENHKKPLKLDKIYFTTFDYEKIFFTIQKLDKSVNGIKYVIIAKALNSEFLSLVSRLTKNYISIVPSYDKSKHDNKHLSINDDVYNYTIDRDDEEILYTYLEFYDEINKQNFYLSMSSKRTIFSNLVNNNINIFYFISILLLFIIFSLYYFISKYFTNRIENISDSIKNLTKNKKLKTTILVEYDDEISYLAKKMNDMFVTIDNKYYEDISKERDFLQSIIDAQENIILITDGSDIKSTNKKFNQHFNSHNSFLSNIALLDTNVKNNFLEIIKNYSSFDNPAKIKLSDKENGYFIFDIKKIDIKNYVVSINDISDINQTISSLNKKASFDELTRCHNKSSIISLCTQWLKIKRFALAIIDIDFFKRINDTYGHTIGDYILRDLIKLLKLNTNQKDIIGRFGGEEFIILIEENNKTNIINMCERLRKKVESEIFIYKDLNINITISIGISLSENKSNFECIFNEADKYLYDVKKSGRNKVNCGF